MGESISANVLPFDKKAPAFDRRRHDRVPAPDIRARPGGDQLAPGGNGGFLRGRENESQSFQSEDEGAGPLDNAAIFTIYS